MKQALSIYLVALAGLNLCFILMGYGAAYALAYGTLVTMAVLIAATFLWLFTMQTTPLALGMAFSWSGAATVMGWWWIYGVLGQPRWMADSELLFVFVSIYLTGAVLHFDVIQRSMALPRWMSWAPLIGCTVLAAGIMLLRH